VLLVLSWVDSPRAPGPQPAPGSRVAGTPCWVDDSAPDLEAAKAFYAGLLGWPFSAVWIEASVDDVATAQSFYAQVFGFHFDEVEGARCYGTFGLDERPLGGLGGRTDGAPGAGSGWPAPAGDEG